MSLNIIFFQFFKVFRLICFENKKNSENLVSEKKSFKDFNEI